MEKRKRKKKKEEEGDFSKSISSAGGTLFPALQCLRLISYLRFDFTQLKVPLYQVIFCAVCLEIDCFECCLAMICMVNDVSLVARDTISKMTS